MRPVIQDNFYMVHPEMVLTAAAVDSDPERRAWAAGIIQCARSKETETIRLYECPSIDWDANDLWNFVDFNSVDMGQCDPPLLRNIKIEDIVNDPMKVRQSILFPCHSQVNEFYVQEGHKCVTFCTGVQQVMGAIRVRKESRQKFPKLEIKKDFLSI